MTPFVCILFQRSPFNSGRAPCDVAKVHKPLAGHAASILFWVWHARLPTPCPGQFPSEDSAGVSYQEKQSCVIK